MSRCPKHSSQGWSWHLPGSDPATSPGPLQSDIDTLESTSKDAEFSAELARSEPSNAPHTPSLLWPAELIFRIWTSVDNGQTSMQKPLEFWNQCGATNYKTLSLKLPILVHEATTYISITTHHLTCGIKNEFICKAAQMVKNVPAMQKTQVQSLGWEDPLGKGMATHSSILAWRIPWREEPGVLHGVSKSQHFHLQGKKMFEFW